VHGVNDVRQTAVHTAEPLIGKHSFAVEKLQMCKSLCTDSNSAELIQAVSATLLSDITQYNSIWNNIISNCHSSGRSTLL
jgi:hypothetical protein